MGFTTTNPDTDDVERSASKGSIKAEADGITFMCQVHLPHKAVVNSAIVYGNPAASAETWFLDRIDISTQVSTEVGNGNINTADLTAANPVIDNSTYGYMFWTTDLDTGDEIWSARIIYTI